MSSDKTAVLFFSRTLNDEYGASSFSLNRKGFSKLYKFFVNKTLETAKNAGLPLIQVYSNQQVGNTFSERLINSLKLVTEQGFERVIIIGNDAPDLTVDDIRLAETALEKGSSVLGQDNRGGVYLIGLDLQKFDLSLLAGVNWHSNKVYQQLTSLLDGVFDLSNKVDVNQLGDLKKLWKVNNTLSQGIIRFFKRLMSLGNWVSWGIESIQTRILETFVNRGPPHFV